MPLFKYRALDADGNAVDGTMEGPFAHQVVVALQEQGFAVNAVRRLGPAKPPVKSRRLSWDDLAQLNSNLLMAAKSGLPLAPSIGAMAQDLDNPRIKPVLEDVRHQLEAGQPLETALERHPGAFNSVYRALVAAGERAGNLPRVFSVLADYSKTMTQVKSDVQLAMFYPMIVAFFGTGLILVLLRWVLPQFLVILEGFGSGLPWPTALVVELSNWVSRNWPLIVGLMVVFAVLHLVFYFNERREHRNYRIDWFKLRIPLVRRVYKLSSIMHFTRALALLLEARVPLLESMELAGAAAGNAVLQRRVRHAARELNAGASVAQALQKTGLYDRGACWLLANAEKNGNLEESLDSLASELARSVAYSRRSITAVLAPMIVVAVGLLLAFIAWAMYAPIFSLGDAI